MGKMLMLYYVKGLRGHIDTMAGSIAERAPRKGDGSRDPSENELPIACFQGRHVVEMAQELRI
ncbi:hypothetical protein [Acidithiobacillus ferridurans]|uniref:hypothetical protein n=1 Tax=Acidithiobacillus ferridurans TaxID=1232575 RepID=UPI001D02EE00|nr:hypothetical protein [Acidithiobacillus ferridurans]